MGDEVWTLVGDAFAIGNFDGRLSEALIVLIPKIDNSAILA